MEIPDWVLNGEGWATIMWDGVRVRTAGGTGDRWEALLDDVEHPTWWWARQTKYASALDNALAEWRLMVGGSPPVGVYQLVGPSIGDNPHGFDVHRLLAIDNTRWKYDEIPRTADSIKAGLERSEGYAGVVFTHPDGRQFIVQRKDFEYVGELGMSYEADLNPEGRTGFK